jgi:hypothetical protein
MQSKMWMKLVLWSPLLLSGCKGFWDPSGTSFTLTNSGAIRMSPGAASGNTSTITVAPSNSFTGSVALTCAVTTSPSNGSSPVTCSLSPGTLRRFIVGNDHCGQFQVRNSFGPQVGLEPTTLPSRKLAFMQNAHAELLAP